MLGESLQKALRKTGYSVDWVQDGADVEPCLKDQDYALVILDLGLPNKSGISILEDIRKSKRDISVLILTASGTTAAKVRGLDTGADEYITKPFALDELEARIRLLLRRKSNRHVPTIAAGGMTLYPATHEVICDGKTHPLSAKEFALMRILMENEGVKFPRSRLEEMLYGWNEEIESNSVEVVIHRIRKKLGQEAIINTKGIGYSIGRGT